MPYWIQSTLAATPALVWMFLGLGLPWALVILPRRDWRDWPAVACLTLAFGPAILTAWMFVLGTGSPLLHIEWILGGTAFIAALGWALVWRDISLGLIALGSPVILFVIYFIAAASFPKVDIYVQWILAGVSIFVAIRWWRSLPNQLEARPRLPLQLDEKLLLALIGIALVIRWIGVAYWPSTAYDALWVYAYEGKLYTLLGYIPHTIGYYPQFLPLQHTYLQLAVGGVDDHAARAVLPWLHLGSIFAAYILGSRLFNRRVGIYVAAIWALYPHVGEWSRYGDLEIPVAFLFTAAAAFLIQAWKNARWVKVHPRQLHQNILPGYTRRYALIAGLLLGIGMWTKPTMGAFIWGVVLLLGVELIYRVTQFRETNLPLVAKIPMVISTASPRIQVAVWCGFASIPLGAVWYLRNILHGHNPIDLPPGYWQTLAARSGVEFGWPLLALLLLLTYLWWHHRNTLPITRLLVGLALVLAGLLPSIYNTGRVGITDNRMGAPEWLALGAGAALLFVTLWRWAADHWTGEGRRAAALIGWSLALALPYFLTWFYSYSYHYRLSFAIVPLLILPGAVILAKWTEKLLVVSYQSPEKTVQSRRVWRSVWIIAIFILSIPGIVSPLYDVNAGWNWLWTDKLPDDHARYQSGNTALMAVVDGLQVYLDTRDEPLRVVAPGIDRLPFFFPLADIQVDAMPTRLRDLENTTYFIYGTPESGPDTPTFIPGANQVLDALALATDDETDTKSVLRRAWWADDGIFKYTVYELYLQKRWEKPEVTIPPSEAVVFGGFLRYLGYDTLDHAWWHDRRLVMNFFWEVLETPPADYVIYIHLRDQDGGVWMAWDAPITRTDDGNYYSSLVWEPGEYIIDRRLPRLTNPDTPLGEDYQVVIGLYDRATEERVPVTIGGQPAGDGFALEKPFAVIPGAG